MKLPLVFLSAIFLFTACSSTQRSDSITTLWPTELPPKNYFLDYYQQDPTHQQVSTQENYLMWVKRFYFGWELYSRGWLQASEELAQTLTNENDRKQAKEKALLIGKLVGPEWAKDKNHRVINTRHLIIWGNALNESSLKQEQLMILEQILSDVNTLLERKMQPKDIASNRYYEPEAFGDNFQ
jgi:hypothetical protein